MPRYRISGLRVCPHFVQTSTDPRQWEFPGTRSLELELAMHGEFNLHPRLLLDALTSSERYFSEASIDQAISHAIASVTAAANRQLQIPHASWSAALERVIIIYLDLPNGSHETFVIIIVSNNMQPVNNGQIAVQWTDQDDPPNRYTKMAYMGLAISVEESPG